MQAPQVDGKVDTPKTDASPPPDGSTKARPRLFKLRAFTSLLLSLSFAVMCFAGVMLFLAPRGRIANWTDWTLLGLRKDTWSSIHVNNSVLFVVLALVHLVWNWSALVRYVKSKAARMLPPSKELIVALVVAAVCLAGPIYGWRPFSSLMALNLDIKDYWEQRARGRGAQPPVPHAEELTLAQFARAVGLPLDQVCSALAELGYPAEDAHLTVRQVADQKGVTPNAVLAAVRERFPESRGWGRLSGSGGRGNAGEHSPPAQRGESAEGSDGAGSARLYRGGGEGRGQGGGWGRGGGMGTGRGMGRGVGSLPPRDADAQDAGTSPPARDPQTPETRP